MINKNNQKKIETVLVSKLQDFFNTEKSQDLLKGKESGHIMGTIVEEKVFYFLQEEEFNVEEPKTAREHADLYIINDSKNRINVKFGSEKIWAT